MSIFNVISPSIMPFIVPNILNHLSSIETAAKKLFCLPGIQSNALKTLIDTELKIFMCAFVDTAQFGNVAN